ncbi:MAG: methyltransferase domain-containing protein [Candidatus Gribaldobacteria bacterium]|nr:methyltransferase domain-containing protein [Candidatus Gribaldobacteria bacterium]
MKQKIVTEGYDKVAENYLAQRNEFKNFLYLERLKSLLPHGSKILDIGCGAGVPIDKYLIEKGYVVTGIDVSEKQIELAKKNVPQAIYAIKNMSELQNSEDQAGAIVSFYARFHTPRETHQELFKKFNSFIPLGGLILITMGASEWEGEEDFHGVNMYWSHYDSEKNKEIIQNAGFQIIFNEIDTSGKEKHQVILAKKIN